MTPDEWLRVKRRSYPQSAITDDRFRWELLPIEDAHAPDVHEVVDETTGTRHIVWTDPDHPRYRITGCAHKHRDGAGVCTLCADKE